MDSKAGKSFDSKVQKVVSSKSPTLCISLRKNKVVINGSQNLVNLFKSNNDLTIKELCRYMVQDMDKTDVYSTTVPFIFPKLTCMFKGNNWSLEVARTNLQVIMSVLGFGQGGEKQYKNIADKPEGWPASVDFATMKHPSYLTISQTNIVIESLLGHHGIDPYSFFDSEKEEIQPPKSKKQKKKSAVKRVSFCTNSAPAVNNVDNVSDSGTSEAAPAEPTVPYVPEIPTNDELVELDFELY